MRKVQWPSGGFRRQSLRSFSIPAEWRSRAPVITRVLVLFSVGTSKGKWGSLLENLFEFKRLYDTEASLEEALPDLVAKYPDRYRNVTLKELSDEMHAAMIELNLTGLVGEACEVDTDPVLTPAQTYQKLLRNGTEKVKFAEMAGRITGVMLVPYPPGIPVAMPGERLGARESAVIRLILAHGGVRQENSPASSARYTASRWTRKAITGCAP